MTPRAAALAVAWLLGVSGCGGFHSDTRRTVTRGAADAPLGDVIRYRALAPDDFRATAPPPGARAHPSGFGAYTCARLVPALPQRVSVRPSRSTGGFVVRAPAAAFHAEMDRGCSWWNRRNEGRRGRYLLRHEQTHFALVELYARRLTVAVRAVRIEVPTEAHAAPAMQARIEQMLDAAVQDLLDETRALDDETARRYNPARLAAWAARVDRELDETPRL